MRSEDGRFTWFGLTLSAGFGDVGAAEIILGLAEEAGVAPIVALAGDGVVPVVRRSRQGGWLVFAFNLQRTVAQVCLRPRWDSSRAQNLLGGAELALHEHSFAVQIEPWSVAVVHCEE